MVGVKACNESWVQQLTALDLWTLTARTSQWLALVLDPTLLIISKSLQLRTFWSQSKALFMIRCMLSVGSESKTFGALKVTILCQIF